MSPFNANVEDRVARASEWALRLMDESMPQKRQEDFVSWLRDDPRNGQALEEVVAAWRAVDYYAASSEIIALRESALAQARRAMDRRRGASPLHGLGWAFAATLLLVLAGVGLWQWLMPQVYATGLGQRRVITLTDGSKIALDGDTIVRVAYSGNERQLWLEKGRALFDDTYDPLRPFSVVAGDKMVVATGTSFSVERIDNEVRVVLYEGHVVVLKASGAIAPRPLKFGRQPLPADYFLKPGNELILPAENIAGIRIQPVSIEQINPRRSLSWEHGLLVFKDEPLDVVVARMNRYANEPLIIGDAAAARFRISGVFRAGDTNALVQGLTAAFGIEARQGHDGISLLAPRHDIPANPRAD
ncbi:MAG: FecR family protein [Steroidobacteraceae bacterium]